MKFLFYFLIIFVVSFSVLNSRFVSAEIKFWFDSRLDKKVIASTPTIPARVGGTSNPVAIHAPATVKKSLPVSPSNRFTLDIPSLKVGAPIVLEQSTDPKKIFNRLSDGVVHYAQSPLPGERGTAIILGHSSAYPWYRGHYGSVFALLTKLKEGDRFYIANGDRTLTYQVSKSLIFNPFVKDKRLQDLEATDDSAVVLVSCWPTGTNSRRIAVRADLIN